MTATTAGVYEGKEESVNGPVWWPGFFLAY